MAALAFTQFERIEGTRVPFQHALLALPPPATEKGTTSRVYIRVVVVGNCATKSYVKFLHTLQVANDVCENREKEEDQGSSIDMAGGTVLVSLNDCEDYLGLESHVPSMTVPIVRRAASMCVWELLNQEKKDKRVQLRLSGRYGTLQHIRTYLCPNLRGAKLKHDEKAALLLELSSTEAVASKVWGFWHRQLRMRNSLFYGANACPVSALSEEDDTAEDAVLSSTPESTGLARLAEMSVVAVEKEAGSSCPPLPPPPPSSPAEPTSTLSLPPSRLVWEIGDDVELWLARWPLNAPFLFKCFQKVNSPGQGGPTPSGNLATRIRGRAGLSASTKLPASPFSGVSGPLLLRWHELFSHLEVSDALQTDSSDSDTDMPATMVEDDGDRRNKRKSTSTSSTSSSCPLFSRFPPAVLADDLARSGLLPSVFRGMEAVAAKLSGGEPSLATIKYLFPELSRKLVLHYQASAFVAREGHPAQHRKELKRAERSYPLPLNPGYFRKCLVASEYGPLHMDDFLPTATPSGGCSSPAKKACGGQLVCPSPSTTSIPWITPVFSTRRRLPACGDSALPRPNTEPMISLPDVENWYADAKRSMLRLPRSTYQTIPLWLIPLVLEECVGDPLYRLVVDANKQRDAEDVDVLRVVSSQLGQYPENCPVLRQLLDAASWTALNCWKGEALHSRKQLACVAQKLDAVTTLLSLRGGSAPSKSDGKNGVDDV